ncbi:carbonic anhydrase, partial [Punctularia strigosozonata HHB-11173 SS5]|uniref:carbonic anhydrase n=1 Tax=Punctularia strigosozonata (strain HHB-11173) TaxID=741275 RepID=UPI000441731F
AFQYWSDSCPPTASDVEQVEPGFFERGAKGQSPKVLWIGCSDSRVPESVVTLAKPGDIFVHRNIANQFHLHDDSVLSVATYAIAAVGVKHVAIVGHTHCGGATHTATLNDDLAVPPLGSDAPINRWLAPLVKLAGEVIASNPTADPLKELVYANVKAQVANLAQSGPVVDAWKQGKSLHIHGWVYDLATGKLEDLGISQGGL